jgi:hypothetical protein
LELPICRRERKFPLDGAFVGESSLMQTSHIAGLLTVLLGCSMSAADFSNHTYIAVSGPFTWHQAKADAEARGGYLATITSKDELDHIASLNAFPKDAYWLGGTDEGHEGTWVWVTGEPWDFTWWAPNEPNNLGIENFVAGTTGTTTDNQWNDWGHGDLTLPAYLLETDICSPHAATATVQISEGAVSAAVVIDPGCGYTNPPAVLIQGGGGTGAKASAQIANGKVTAINVTAAGCCYTNTPAILIGSPPFQPAVSIEVSQVRVRQRVVLGRRYVLEASHNLSGWTPAGPIFTAEAEDLDSVFDVAAMGRFFRIREVP